MSNISAVKEHEYPVIGEGMSARVLRVSAQQVLKVFKPHLAPLLAEREFFFASLAYDAGIPTPQPLEKQRFGDADAILYEFRPGKNLDSYTLPRPWFYRSASWQMADIHAQIHRIEPVLNEEQFRQKDFFCELIGYSETLPSSLKQHCLKLLDHANDGSSLCHGDMSPSNLMRHKGKNFVIDWSLAAIGNPIGDFAFTWVGINGLSQTGDLNPIVKAILRRSCDWYLERYQEQHGTVSAVELKRWLAPAAAARLGALEKAEGPEDMMLSLRALIEKYCDDTPELG